MSITGSRRNTSNCGSLAAQKKAGGPGFHADAAAKLAAAATSANTARALADKLRANKGKAAEAPPPAGGSAAASHATARTKRDSAASAFTAAARNAKSAELPLPTSPGRPASARRMKDRPASGLCRRSPARPPGRAASEAGYSSSSHHHGTKATHAHKHLPSSHHKRLAGQRLERLDAGPAQPLPPAGGGGGTPPQGSHRDGQGSHRGVPSTWKEAAGSTHLPPAARNGRIHSPAGVGAQSGSHHFTVPPSGGHVSAGVVAQLASLQSLSPRLLEQMSVAVPQIGVQGLHPTGHASGSARAGSGPPSHRYGSARKASAGPPSHRGGGAHGGASDRSLGGTPLRVSSYGHRGRVSSPGYPAQA